MTLTLDHLAARDSPLRRIDSRWKLAALVPAAFLIAPLRSWPAALTALAASEFLVLLSGVPLRWYLARLGNLLPFLLLLIVLLPFLVNGPGPGWDLGPLHLSLHGLVTALVLCSKTISIVSLGLVVLTTSPLGANLKAAHALRLPGLLVHLLLLTYRYAFMIADELGRLRIAVRVRGFRSGVNVHTYRTVGHVSGTLLVRSHERAERVSQAMRCRGFDGKFRTLATFQTHWTDVAFFLGIVSGAAFLLAWDLSAR